MTTAQVDVLNVKKGSIKGAGDVAGKLLANNFDVQALRTNDTLMYDEWKEMDMTVIKAAQERLVAVQQMIGRGLVYNVPNGLGKTVLAYQDMSDIDGADVSMHAISKSMRDRPEYDINYMPLPVIHKDFSFSIREIEASRNGSMPLDMTMAQLAARKVAEKAEEIFFQGLSAYTFGGGTLRGIEDYTNANTGSLNAAWDASSTTGKMILNDLKSMKQDLIDEKMYGPYGVFIPTAYETKLDEDYEDQYAKTIRQRLEEMNNIDFIQVADKATATKVSMVQLTEDVIRIVMGLPITTVEWDSEGGLKKNFKVMAIMLPQPRATQEGDCGIAVYSE